MYISGALHLRTWDCHGCDRMVVGFTATCAISAYHQVVSSNPAHGQVYSIQHYVIKLVSNLRQVGGFFPHQKTDRQNITAILLKVALNMITLTITN